MEADKLVRALSTIEGIHVTVIGSSVRVYVAAIDDGFGLLAGDVDRCSSIFAPNGDPALELVLRRGETERPLIVTPTDLVFSPAETNDQIESDLPIVIDDAPPIVACSEMERAAERVAARASESVVNLDQVGAGLLLVRSFIMGAIELGMWPRRTMAWWQRAWTAINGDVFAPFVASSVWDELADDAANVVLDDSAPSESVGQTTFRPVNRDDLSRLAPTLSIVGLDDELVASWNSWLCVDPNAVVRALSEGLAGVTLHMSLYREGKGTVDLVLASEDAEPRALMQVRFSIPEGELHIDEMHIADAARGAGLFQRLLFNAEQYGVLLGLTQLKVLATGIGAYALATVGRYPRDPKLRQRAGRDSG